jgi:hypothetical protein
MQTIYLLRVLVVLCKETCGWLLACLTVFLRGR